MEEAMERAVQGLRRAPAEQADAETACVVSLRAEVPEALLQAMAAFIERHPNWDQYRLFQAALAGFLVQNGIQNREVTRCYLANLFPSQRRFAAPAPRRALPRAGSLHGASPSPTPRVA